MILPNYIVYFLTQQMIQSLRNLHICAYVNTCIYVAHMLTFTVLILHTNTLDTCVTYCGCVNMTQQSTYSCVKLVCCAKLTHIKDTFRDNCADLTHNTAFDTHVTHYMRVTLTRLFLQCRSHGFHCKKSLHRDTRASTFDQGISMLYVKTKIQFPQSYPFATSYTKNMNFVLYAYISIVH